MRGHRTESESSHSLDYYSQDVDAGGAVTSTQHGDVAMRTHSEATPAGIRLRMSGHPAQGEFGNRAVAETLAAAMMHRSGVSWVADAEPPSRTDTEVDWFLRADRRGVCGVQITRVGPRERWAAVARGGRLDEEISADEAADEIWQAIVRKSHVRGGILALAVGQPGGHAFPDVLDSFRRLYAARVPSSVGFTEVWLVGYSLETTVRIHPG